MLKRQWIGIDISPTACRVMAKRLRDVCGLKESEPLWKIGRGFVVRDLPWTPEKLRVIPPFEFENWAVIALGGIPNKTQVGDMGLDGRIFPVSAPDLAGDPNLASDFRLHHTETEQQAALVLKQLEAHGESPSALQGAIMKLGGKGFLLFAQLMPETPGRLAAHAYSYEAMEWAGYEMLGRFAEAAGDAQTADVARQIGEQERTMMKRLESHFDNAEQASHRDTEAEKLPGDLRKHIAEAHALENQGIKLLGKSEDIAGDPALAQACGQNLAAAPRTCAAPRSAARRARRQRNPA